MPAARQAWLIRCSLGITPHSAATKTDLRDPAELDEWRARDPIVRLRAQLEADGFDTARLDAIEGEMQEELERMRERGLAAPFPSELRTPEFKD